MLAKAKMAKKVKKAKKRIILKKKKMKEQLDRK
jgi:hypothetical protein